MFKAVSGLAPDYISNMLQVCEPQRVTRQSQQNGLLLVERRTKRKTFAHRAFSCAGPRLWNQLPRVIRDAHSENIFKDLLKQHMFQNAYAKYNS